MADFYIGQSDTASTLLATLRDANGAAVDITGASVHIDVTPIHGGTKTVDAAATIVTPAAGIVSYTFTAPQTATPGDYLATFTVTFGGGAVESFPNAGYYLVTINPDAPTVAQEYVSVEELRKELNLQGTTYADQSMRRAVQAASKALDNITGRRFTLGSPGESRVYRAGPSADYLYINDVTAVTSVVQNGATLALNTDYTLQPTACAFPGPPYDVLRAPRSSLLGTFGTSNGWADVTVTGTYGWPSVPAPIQEATMILAARYLQRTRSAPFAILTFGDGGEAARLTRTDPDFASLVGPYTRSTGMVE